MKILFLNVNYPTLVIKKHVYYYIIYQLENVMGFKNKCRLHLDQAFVNERQ